MTPTPLPLTYWVELPTITGNRVLRRESYMRLFVPQISIGILLIHVLLGCCWHHGHSCVSTGCRPPTPIAGICNCGGHADESDANAAESDSFDHPVDRDHVPQPHRCAGGHCTFLRSERLAAQQRGPCGHSIPYELTASGYSKLSCAITKSVVASALPDPLCEEGPPIRRHLLLHILLI